MNGGADPKRSLSRGLSSLRKQKQMVFSSPCSLALRPPHRKCTVTWAASCKVFISQEFPQTLVWPVEWSLQGAGIK